MSNLNNAGPTLSYKQKREVEQLVRAKAADYLRTMEVPPVYLVEATKAQQALAHEYAIEVRNDMANVLHIEATHL
jgi:hypothetical protein